MGHCYNSTVINADCQTVWKTVRDFHDLDWAEGVVMQVETVGQARGTEVGAQRVLNGVFHETLQGFDDDTRTLTYSIDDGPGPVARAAVDDYLGTLHVAPVTDSNQSFVEWYSSFRCADEAAVGELCNPIYRALLGALKKHLQG